MLCLLCVSNTLVYGHAHTHIGRNQDQTWGTADDNQLWVFSMPGTTDWPQWGEPLPLVYQQSGELAGYWVCEELDCWHSAHPDHGNWQLGGDDPEVAPDWAISLERVAFSSGFFMVEEESLSPVLQNDSDRYPFESQWMEDVYNEQGTLGAWGLHCHLLFCAQATGAGEYFTATFRAIDTGSTGYAPSEDYSMTFVTVPEPAAITLLITGGWTLFRRKQRKTGR